MSLWTPKVAPGTDEPRTLELPHGEIKLRTGQILRPIDTPTGLDPHTEDAGAWCTYDSMNVIASLDTSPHGRRLLHVSVARPSRDPSWKEIVALREAFYSSSVDVAMILPRPEDYVNVHQHAFHMWQIPVRWGLL